MSPVNPADEARRWLRIALDDLRLSEVIAAASDHAPHLACFHAQQATEKVLKSILIFLQARFPFTHDLDLLRDVVPSSWNVVTDHPDLSWLSGWAVEGRYPGNWPEASDQDAKVAATQARAVWETVLDDLDRHGMDVSAFR